MIKVIDLIKDGIWLVEDDILCKPDSYYTEDSIGVKVNNRTWIGEGATDYISTGRFDGWYVKSFAERKNETEERPVPTWCKVESNSLFKPIYEHFHLGVGMVWYKEDWHPEDTWKPDYDFLVKHYAEVSKQEVDTNVPEQEESVSSAPAESVMYSKDMLNNGTMPKKGMLVNFGGDYTPVEGISWSNGEESILTGIKIHTTDGYGYLHELTFPEPKETLEDKAKKFYAEHMDLHPNEIDYMWGQCGEDYKQAWLTIVGADDE